MSKIQENGRTVWNFDREKEPAKWLNIYPYVEVLRIVREPGQEKKVRVRNEHGSITEPVLRTDKDGQNYFRAAGARIYVADLIRIYPTEHILEGRV